MRDPRFSIPTSSWRKIGTKIKNMPKIHPGHEVLSLFGMPTNNPALNQVASSAFTNRSIVATLVSAFLIILAASLILAFTIGNFNFSLPAVAPTVSTSNFNSINEPVAFQPSQAVSQEISRGYLLPQ